jgi:flagellin
MFDEGQIRMRINHNLSAQNSYRSIQNNHNLITKSTQRLSSGLRINQAADDASGLSISEKMRSQIRGLEQASRNIQDGISLLQTTDSGLGLIIDPNLVRLKELAVQAANGTLSPDERQSIQVEVDQIKKGINQIATDTEFNSQKLLCPPTNYIPPVPGTPPSPKTGKADIVFVIDNTASMASSQTIIANNINSLINSINNKGVSDIRMGVVEFTDNDIIMSQFSENKWTTDLSSVSDEILRLATTNRGGTEYSMKALSSSADFFDFRENDNGLQTKHMILVTNEPANDEGLVTATLSNLQSKGIQVHGVYPKTNSDVSEFDDIVNGTGGKSVDLSNPTWGTELSSVIGDSIGDSAGSADEGMPTLLLQVGANVGESFKITLFDARTPNLGINNLKVDPWEEAVKSIELIDTAIQKASTVRAKFGAYQNALEHMNQTVLNVQTNLSAAESQIRDVDMAKEITKLTSKQAILEAANAMLAQANKIPQSVLEFLKQ